MNELRRFVDWIVTIIAAISAEFTGVYFSIALMNVGSDEDSKLRGLASDPTWTKTNYQNKWEDAMSLVVIFGVCCIVLGLYIVPKYHDYITSNKELRTYMGLSLFPGMITLISTGMFCSLAQFPIPNTTRNLIISSVIQLIGGLFIVFCLKWPNLVSRPVHKHPA